MPKHVYRCSRADLLDYARDIAEEYADQDLTMTLRQLYYQLVARGYVDNNQKVYKRTGDILTKARLSGDFPFEHLVDRGRTSNEGYFTGHYDSVDNALYWAGNELRQAPESKLHINRWWGQPTHVSVWYEKQALEGVFDVPCSDLGVSSFACKGYPSISSLYEWVQQLGRVFETAQEDEDWWDFEDAVILYFGDHDPDGIEIPEAAERRITEIAEAARIEIPPVTFQRCALTLEQIREHNPPPYPAKPSSSRYKKYVDRYNVTDAWELDALDPATLRGLIRTNVERHFDEGIHAENQRHIETKRVEMRSRMDGDWVRSALGVER